MKKTTLTRLLALALAAAMLLPVLAGCSSGGAETEHIEKREKSSDSDKESKSSGKKKDTSPADGDTEPDSAALGSISSADLTATVSGIRQAEAPRQMLVQDTALYETMVHGRYYDLWDRRSDYFTVPELYVFEKTLINIQETDAGIAWLANYLAGKLVGEEADRDNYIRILLMLVLMQAQGYTQSSDTLTDYDTLKGLPEYKDDLLDIGTDVLDLIDLDTAAQLEISLMGTSYDLAQLGVESVAEYEMYKAAAHNYNNAYVFLSAIENRTDVNELREAAHDLLGLLDEARGFIFGGDMTKLSADALMAIIDNDLLLTAFVALLEDYAPTEEMAADVLKMVNGLEDKVTYLVPGLTEAKIAFKSTLLAGDLVFGTSNTFNRYAEMRCLSAICSAVGEELDSMGYSPAREEGGITKAEKAVPLMQFQLLARMRGEYCVEALVLEDGGVQTKMVGMKDNADENEIRSFFATQDAVLSEIYADADRILCTGNEVYYRYLRDVLVKEYGWAVTGSHDWEVPDLYSVSKGSLPGIMEAYKNEKTGEAGNGILSAYVRDFDGDNVNDMLVLYLVRGKSDDTAIAPVYGGEDASVIQARLYSMQYTARPDDAVSARETVDFVKTAILDRTSGLYKKILEGVFNWVSIIATNWTPVDRYTVYERFGPVTVAELGALCLGTIVAGVTTWEDVPYLYTYEWMEDATTYGPFLTRVWHVDDNGFVLDTAQGWIGWGQGTKVQDVPSYLKAAGVSFNDTGVGQAMLLAARGDQRKSTEEDPNLSQLLGSLLLRINYMRTTGTEKSITTRIEDLSYIRKILEVGEGEALKARGEEPDLTPKVNEYKSMASDLADELASATGIALSINTENTFEGTYTANYKSAKGSAINISISPEGKFTNIQLTSPYAEESGEWIKLKDALVKSPALNLPSDIQTKFTGACGYSVTSDFTGGSAYTAAVASVIFGLRFS